MSFMCAARLPRNYILTRGCLGLCPSLRRFFYERNVDKELSTVEAPERPTPPPAHVAAAGLRKDSLLPPQTSGGRNLLVLKNSFIVMKLLSSFKTKRLVYSTALSEQAQLFRDRQSYSGLSFFLRALAPRAVASAPGSREGRDFLPTFCDG